MVLDSEASSRGSHTLGRVGGWGGTVEETLIGCMPLCVSASIASILSWVLYETLAGWGKWAFFLLLGLAVRVQEMICCDKPTVVPSGSVGGLPASDGWLSLRFNGAYGGSWRSGGKSGGYGWRLFLQVPCKWVMQSNHRKMPGLEAFWTWGTVKLPTNAALDQIAPPPQMLMLKT